MADQQQINNQKNLNQAIQDGTANARDFLNAFEALNPVQQEGVRIAVERTAEARDFSDILKSQLGITEKRTDAEKALLGISRDVVSAAEENLRLIQSTEGAKKAVEARTKTLSDASREILIAESKLGADQISNANKIFEATQALNAEVTKQVKLQEELDTVISEQLAAEAQLQALRSSDKSTLEQIAAQEQVVERLKEQAVAGTQSLAFQNQQVANADAAVEAAARGTDEATQQLALAKALGEQAAKNNAEALEQEKIQKQVKYSLGLVGNTLKGLKGFFGEGLLAGFQLDEVQKDMEKFSQDAKGNVSRFQVLGKGLQSAFSNLGSVLKDPAVAVGALFKSYMEFEKANREVRQLTGQTATNIEHFNTSMISSIDAAKTIGSLSKEIGINVNAAFSAETITAASELTNLLGVSEKSAANLALRAEAFGGSLKGADETMYDTVANFNKTNRSAVNVGQVMEDVGNSSDSLALSLGGSVEELTQAAASAARLGINLQQAEGIADKLLNFEQSIQDELEAELLTGKEINLEKAREAALNNDMATLTEEIGNNTQIMEAFSSGNRIQQEAIAKSLGMSKDEVAKMIFLKQKENGLTDEQASKAAGLNIEAAKRLDAQASIQKSIEKLTAVLAPVLAKVADFIAIITSNSAGLIATYSVLGLALFPKLRAITGGIAGNIKESYNSAKDLVKGIGGAVGKFKEAGAAGEGFFGKVKSVFSTTVDKVDEASSVKDAATDVSDVAGKVGDASDTLGGINGKNIKKFFQDLAAGLRSFGSAKVLMGIGNMVLFAPAAVIAVAAIPFLSFIGGIKLPFLKSNLTGLGQGLTKLSSGIVGVAVLALAGPAMVASLLAIPFLTFMGLTPLVMLQSNFTGLGQGLLQLGMGLPGVLVLSLLGPAGALALLSVPFLAAMAIPGFGVAIGTGLGGLAAGLTALGTAAATGLPFLAVGLIASIGLAMIPFALSLRLVTPLVEAFGNIFIGVFSALPPIIEAVAGGIVTVFGGIGDLISSVAQSLLSLASPEVALGLITLAPALAALGFSMQPLGLGLASLALSAGLLAAITGDTNPFGMFEKLAEYAPGIDMASSAIAKMSVALGELQSALDKVDSEKLSDVMNPSLGGVVLGLGTAAIQGATDAVTGVADSISGMFGGEGGDGDPVVEELRAVKEVLNQILAKEGNVQIDTSRAGTAFALGTSRLQ